MVKWREESVEDADWANAISIVVGVCCARINLRCSRAAKFQVLLQQKLFCLWGEELFFNSINIGSILCTRL